MIPIDAYLRLRPWRESDRGSLVRYANNREIWLNLKDRFPHPYTEADADRWLSREPATAAVNFAIELDGEAIGGVGLEFLTDVHRLTADIGYWLGEPFWGRGTATKAVKAATAYAFATFDLRRIQATAYEWNPASMRVLEKADYRREARLRSSIVKDGRIGDSMLYARLRDEG